MSSSRVKPISDPHEKNGQTAEMPTRMKLRRIDPYEESEGILPVHITSLKNLVPDKKIKGLKRLVDTDFQCIPICEQVLDSIEAIDDNYGFTIGKGGHRLYCGHVIQTIPRDTFVKIGFGKSIYSGEPPVTDVEGTGGSKKIFKFDKTRHLAIRVGKNQDKDWAVVVGSNGCIFLDSGSYASIHMPVFVVEQTGGYYRVNKGNRLMLLGTGHHLILYTNEAPIIFVRKHTDTKTDFVPTDADPIELESDSSTSDKSLAHSKKEKSVTKKIRSNDDDSGEDKSEKEPSKKKRKRSSKIKSKIRPRILTEGTALVDPSEGRWIVYPNVFGLILLLLFILYYFYRLLFVDWKPVSHRHRCRP